MADSKHSQGEWKSDMFQTISGKYPIRGGITCFGTPHVIAWVNAPSSAQAGEAEANCRLIEAAPDLLTALKAILHTYDDGGTPLSVAFDMANKAIAKAGA